MAKDNERAVTFEEARRWILKTSLMVCAGVFAFFMIAPALGYPLSFAESFRLMQLVFPVFVGYAGQAAYFLFAGQNAPQIQLAQPDLFSLILKGPIVVFLISFFLLCAVFGWVNRTGQTVIGSGMTPEQFSLALAVLLGLLTVTTNAVVSFLVSVYRSCVSREVVVY